MYSFIVYKVQFTATETYILECLSLHTTNRISFWEMLLLKTKQKTLLTSRVPAEDKFSNLIIYKDEKAIRESTKPPAWPVGKTRKQKGFKIIAIICTGQSVRWHVAEWRSL